MLYYMDEHTTLCDDLLKRLDEDEKDALVIRRAKRDAKYQFYKTLFLRSFVQDFMDDGKVPDEAKLTVDEKLIIQKQVLRNSTKPPYIFLTVSPRPDITLNVFKNCIEKFIMKKFIKEYAYVYEVRDCQNGIYTGLHSHILCRYVCRPYDFLRASKTAFKNVCNVNHSDILNVKYILEELLPDKISYMLGNKKKSKERGVELSRAYRQENDMPEIFESSPPFPCRATPSSSLK